MSLFRIAAIFSFAVCNLQFVFAQSDNTVKQSFSYSVFPKTNPTVKELRKDWWTNYISPSEGILFDSIFEWARSGKILAYHPDFPFDKEMSSREILKSLAKHDTLVTEDPVTMELVNITVVDPFGFENVARMDFDVVLNGNEGERIKGITFWFWKDDPLTGEKSAIAVPRCHIKFDSNAIVSNKILPTIYEIDNVVLEGVPDDTRPSGFTSYKKNMLNSLRKKLQAQDAVLCDTVFPFNKILTKKQRKSFHLDTAGINDFKISSFIYLNTKAFKLILLNRSALIGFKNTQNDISRFNIAACIPIYMIDGGPDMPEILSANFITDTTKTRILLNERATTGIDSAAFLRGIGNVMKKVENGDISAYHHFNRPMPSVKRSKMELHNILYQTDTTLNENPETGAMDTVIISRGYDKNSLSKLNFFEVWDFNHATGLFNKTITELDIFSFVNHDDVIRTNYLFTIKPGPVTEGKILLSKRVTSIVPVTTLESQSLNTSWEYPFVLYIDDPRQHIEIKKRIPFLESIVISAENKVIKAYLPEDKTRKKPVDPKMIRSLMLKFLSDAGADKSNFLAYVEEIGFDEEWWMDPTTGAFVKKVKSVTFYGYKPGKDADQMTTYTSTPIITFILNNP